MYIPSVTSSTAMSQKEEAEPLITYTPIPQRRPGASRLRFFLALGLCFVLLTGSWHAYSWVSVSPSVVELMIASS